MAWHQKGAKPLSQSTMMHFFDVSLSSGQKELAWNKQNWQRISFEQFIVMVLTNPRSMCKVSLRPIIYDVSINCVTGGFAMLHLISPRNWCFPNSSRECHAATPKLNLIRLFCFSVLPMKIYWGWQKLSSVWMNQTNHLVIPPWKFNFKWILSRGGDTPTNQ